MNQINLRGLELKTFTQQDALDYCNINSLNPLNITELSLTDNKLRDISEIKIFKNLEILFLGYNQINDISVLKNLNNLEILYLFENKLTDISVLKNLTNLEILDISNNEITDISVLKDLNKLEILNIDRLFLDYKQSVYINKLKNLKELQCEYGFKNNVLPDDLNIKAKIFKN